MKAFFVKHPEFTQPGVVLAETAGKARYRYYLHCKGLGRHMLRSSCGLRMYTLAHFTAHRATAYDQLAERCRQDACAPRCWDKDYATAALRP